MSGVVFVTDNYNVYNTYNRGPKAASNSANCDLYRELFGIVVQKGILLTARWMPSHLGLNQSDDRPDLSRTSM